MRLLIRETREIATPISKEGIAVDEVESLGYAGGVKATDFSPDKRPEVFTPWTVILNSGYGVWELSVPKDVLENLIDMTLKIETVRTHGMLHTPKFDHDTGERRYAWIWMNDVLVDKISLVKPHPHGEDFGVDSRRSIPVFGFVDESKETQTIKVEVDDKVLWDIDRITLEPILLRKELSAIARFVIGTIVGGILSPVFGGLMGLLVF